MTLENVRIAYASLRRAAETGEPVDPPRRALVEAIAGFDGATDDMRRAGRDLAEFGDHLRAPEIVDGLQLQMFEVVNWRHAAAWQESYPLYAEPTAEQLAAMAIPDYRQKLFLAYAELRHAVRGGDTRAVNDLRANLRSAIATFKMKHSDLPRLGLEEAFERISETEGKQLTVEFVEALAPFLFGGAEPEVPAIDRGKTAIEFLREIIPHALAQRSSLVRSALRTQKRQIDLQQRVLEATLALPPDVVQGLLQGDVPAVREWARATLDAQE
jgi:hypothetical protein